MQDIFTLSPFFTASLVVLAAGEAMLLFFVVRLFSASKRILDRQDTLFAGKSVKSLEEVILGQAENLKAVDKDVQELFEISNRIHRLAFKSIHKVGVVRFNPFKEVGSNQSFVIAFLDGKNSGTVLSSLHTREGSRIYAKPITGGESELFPLTEEEKQAILLAQQSQETAKK
jgi:hypothetical protein